MSYYLSDIPSDSLIEIINKYRPQIESNLEKLGITLNNDKEVCLRWGIIFAKLNLSADIRVGKLVQPNKDPEQRVWMVIVDEQGKKITFDPCSKDPDLDSLEKMYFLEKVYELENLGNGNARQDFMTLLSHKIRFCS